MRILHTSDWHLNDRLDRVPRQPDIVARLEEIAGYLDEHKVDVMIVSGDLFSQFGRLQEVRNALADVQRIFKPFLLCGGTIVGISGNHDDEALFDLLHCTLDLAAPIGPTQTRPRPNGRLYLTSRPTLLLLEDRQGQQVQFALLPYPTVARYLRDEETQFKSLEERNRLLHQAMINKLRDIQENHINSRLPAVLVAHAHIRGSELHNLYRLTERDDVVFDAIDLPMNWAYAAYGHIHKPQAMAGTTHVRYAGSIERFDFGEMSDKEKSVVLVEVGTQGRIGEPRALPLNATPLYRVEICDPETELPTLRERYPDASRAIVEYKLTYKPGQHNRDEICREVETIFPRCCHRQVIPEGSTVEMKTEELRGNLRDVRGTVQNFLSESLANNPNRDELLTLVEQLLLEAEV